MKKFISCFNYKYYGFSLSLKELCSISFNILVSYLKSMWLNCHILCVFLQMLESLPLEARYFFLVARSMTVQFKNMRKKQRIKVEKAGETSFWLILLQFHCWGAYRQQNRRRLYILVSFYKLGFAPCFGAKHWNIIRLHN